MTSPDSEPAQHQPSRWHQPRWWIAAALGLLVLFTLSAIGARVYKVRTAIAAVEHSGGHVSTSTPKMDPLVKFFSEALLGIADGPTTVTLSYTGITDDGLRTLVPHLRQFERILAIECADADISDDGIAALAEFNELRSLELTNTGITDAGLELLRQFPNLHRLRLDGTQVTGDGLVHLLPLDQLEQLSLDGTAVDDASLHHLAQIPSLRELSLSNTEVTDAGTSVLRSVIPLLELSDD